MSNAEIADRLLSLAQLLSAGKENPFKVKAYRRAAKTIKGLALSVEDWVAEGSDLTDLSGIGRGIAAAIGEIVRSGTSSRLEALRTELGPQVSALSEYPRLDPVRVLRIYKKLGVSSVDELKASLESGAIASRFGAFMDRHVREALTQTHAIRLYDADPIVEAAEEFLVSKCGVARAAVTGDCRRRVEVVSEISFLISTADFPAAAARFQKFGGGIEPVTIAGDSALFQLPDGITVRLECASERRWGLALVLATGSGTHVDNLKIKHSRAAFEDEEAVYRKLGLTFIEPELREGHGEIDLAARGTLPTLIERADIRGDLHAHSTSSDGVNSIEQMARAAAELGYEYLGITDHSQRLKIAGGVPEPDLWKQLRFIDKLNAKASRLRILKSAEVDILSDGSLDYSNDLLKELDYTVCSIHSRFALGREAQTERIIRAMDNPYFTILGHATGRKLLKRPGYEINIERVIAHARSNGCFFEINSSPDRLDLSAENARLAKAARVKISINTDAHSMREFDLIDCGIDQARRAGLDKDAVLNARHWDELRSLLKR